MSCNLDHVLYNKRNSTDEEKENDAYAFAKQYKGDRDGFVKFISESSFSVNSQNIISKIGDEVKGYAFYRTIY